MEFGLFLRNFAQLLLFALAMLVLGRMLVSWVDPVGRNQASAFLIQTTEPLLAPVRRILPPTGMIDLSATLVFIGLMALARSI